MFAFSSSIECGEECWIILNYDLRVDMPGLFTATVKMMNIQKFQKF